jgi:hypothetical protein
VRFLYRTADAKDSPQNTARIDRTIGNMIICRTFMRVGILHNYHARRRLYRPQPGIPTADYRVGIGALAGLSHSSMVARSVRSVSCELL